MRPAAMIPAPRRLLAFALVVSASLGLLAWDTKEALRRPAGAASGVSQDHHRAKWAGLYYCHERSAALCTENEHAWLAHVALERAAPGYPWGFSPRTQLYALDLNAGYFRDEISTLSGAWPDEADVMGIPRRALAGAPNWAGVPDISYSIYDWINKNELCPPMPTGELPPDTPGDCHNYTYWQGGGFNASHFGSQATMSYRQLHRTALNLAGRARRMREALGDDPANLELHGDAVREAELMALAYEGYAQHFLQDRWAMGHMFERWGAPEYSARGAGVDVAKALITGGFTGIVHGYQSVTHLPDALSSPEVVDRSFISNLLSYAKESLLSLVGLGDTSGGRPPAEIYVPEWRHEVGPGDTHGGVGDYRGQDMMRGSYAARFEAGDVALEYNSDMPINVVRQREEMLQCSAAGFKSVIEGFGTNSAGGYGIDGVNVNASIPSEQGHSCFDIWATNESMAVGFGPEFATAGALASLGRMIIQVGRAIGETVGTIEEDDEYIPEVAAFVYSDRSVALDTTRIYAWVKLRAYQDPSGIDLARGGMSDLVGVPTGDNFPVASYFEPPDLTTLGDEDPRGRDAQTIFGFFNRAHADWFCARSDRMLGELRRATRERERATCRILAQRVYEGVREDTPIIEEYLSAIVDGERQQADPLCEIASSNWSSPRLDGDGLAELHPGYVSWDFSRDQSRAFEMDDEGLAYRSVANWCDAVPVIDFSDDEDEADAGVVAVVEDTRDTLTIEGRHFGDEPGELLAGRSPQSAVAITDIEDWRDDRIRFSVENVFADIRFNAQDETYLFIRRAVAGGEEDPGRASVGRFVLRRDVVAPRIARVEIGGEERDAYYRYTAPPLPDADVSGVPAEGFAEASGTEVPEADEDNAFYPVPPAETLTVEIEFDAGMEPDTEREAFLLNGEPIEGDWAGERRWRGTVEVADADGFRRGGRTLSVMARSTRGAFVDGDPETEGAQPDTDHRLLFDTLPVFLDRIAVRGGGRTIYDARWRGELDYEDEPNLTHRALGNPERRLDVARAGQAPAEGEGRMRLQFSADLDAAPIVRIGGAEVEFEGEAARWEGRFDFAEAATGQDENGDLPVDVRLGDGIQDADPRTGAVIGDPARWSSGLYWEGLESERGGATSARGGPDRWHRIGPPPALSLLVILDGSGSMETNNRMGNAKTGIMQTLDNLPEDQVIEVGLVAFTDCNSYIRQSFTRDIERVRERVNSISPSGGTPLAAAHDQGRALFAASGDPRAEEWRFATFTDGAETCDGNVVASARALQSLVNAHRAPDRVPPEDPPAPEPPDPPAECRVASWRGYAVDVEDGGRHLDRIRLVEHSYIERALPDGRCLAWHERETYGVYYGSIRTRGGDVQRARWGINSEPSETETEFASSARSEARLRAVRDAASRVRGTLVDLDAARERIDRAVQTAQPESG